MHCESKVSCWRREQNVPNGSWTQTAQSGDEHTNHEALQFPQSSPLKFYKIVFSSVKFYAEFEVALPKQVLSVTSNHLKSGFHTVNSKAELSEEIH